MEGNIVPRLRIPSLRTPAPNYDAGLLFKRVALTGVAQCVTLQTERSPIQFLVRAYAWVVGQVLG